MCPENQANCENYEENSYGTLVEFEIAHLRRINYYILVQILSTKLYDCTIDNLININEVFFHLNLHFNLAKMSQKPGCLNADVKCFGKLSKQKAFLISCFKLYANLANIMEFSQLSSPASVARDRWP